MKKASARVRSTLGVARDLNAKQKGVAGQTPFVCLPLSTKDHKHLERNFERPDLVHLQSNSRKCWNTRCSSRNISFACAKCSIPRYCSQKCVDEHSEHKQVCGKAIPRKEATHAIIFLIPTCPIPTKTSEKIVMYAKNLFLEQAEHGMRLHPDLMFYSTQFTAIRSDGSIHTKVDTLGFLFNVFSCVDLEHIPFFTQLGLSCFGLFHGQTMLIGEYQKCLMKKMLAFHEIVQVPSMYQRGFQFVQTFSFMFFSSDFKILTWEQALPAPVLDEILKVAWIKTAKL